MIAIDWKQAGKEAMASMEFEIDLRAVNRGAFGLFKWRLRLGMLFMRIAFWLLRSQLQFRTGGA